jgi:hypothetical protein
VHQRRWLSLIFALVKLADVLKELGIIPEEVEYLLSTI